MTDEQPKTDLIMRPTTQEPGLYEEDGQTYAVTGFNGEYYRMLWCDAKDTNAILQSNDMVFSDAYVSSMTYDFGDNPDVKVEAMSFEPACPMPTE